ncbi:VanZ family protein [Paenibacillus sp. P25]|nr:VanZ family protein [Paenibacillus sp. P25]
MIRFLLWSPSVLWMAVIFYLSSRTGDDLGSWLDVIRQWIPAMEGFDSGHFAACFILSMCFLIGSRPERLTWKNKLVPVILCILYGVTDEYHQSFVPGRTPDLLDLWNDAIGATLAMLLVGWPPAKRWLGRLTGAKYC